MKRIAKWFLYEDVTYARRCIALLIDVLFIISTICTVNLLFECCMLFFNTKSLFVINMVLFSLLFVSRDAFFNGQSLGKRFLLYHIVDEDLNKIKTTLRISVKRNLPILIPFIELYPIVKNKRRLGEKWSKTTLARQFVAHI